MKLLSSKKGLELPKLFFVTNKEEVKELPIGVPFFMGDPEIEEYIVRILEYEVLFQNAIKTGYPFNFKKILKDNGYDDIQDFSWHETVYMDYVTKGMLSDDDYAFEEFGSDRDAEFKKYVKDSSCYVNIEKIKSLNIFPVWLDKIEEAISTNIHNFSTFNPNMYNKKLDGMYGAIELSSPPRNLIIIDISGSIPKAVSTTTLTLAKNLSETFYADILITGSKSTLYEYERIHELDVNGIYKENGTDNDQTYFKKLVSSEKKIYNTVICFGDNHSPSYPWSNNYNKRNKEISREDGQKLCKWEVKNLISFHTTSERETAGYADWFTFEPENVQKISNWVEYLK